MIFTCCAALGGATFAEFIGAARRGVWWGRSFIGSHADSVISREVDKDTCTLLQLIAAHSMASFTHPHFGRES